MISKSDIDLQSKEIGSRVRRRRTLLGLRLEDLSMISGVTVATMSHMERGSRNTKLSTLLAVAAALRMKPSSLFEEDGDAESELSADDGGSEMDQNSASLPELF